MKCGLRIAATIVAGRTRTVARRGLLIGALLSLAMVAADGQATAAPPTPVFLIEADNIIGGSATEIVSEGVFTGTIGTVPVSGTTHMEVRVVGQTFHCTHTWVSGASTLVFDSDCNMMTLNGQWRDVSGTGIFANFFAQGSLFMDLDGYDLDGVTYQVAEILTGSAH